MMTEGGYWQDVPLLERLVHEKLAAEAEAVKAEGWAWVDTAIEFPWNHQRDYRRLKPLAPALSDDEQEKFEALATEYDELAADSDAQDAGDATSRFAEIGALLAMYENKSPVFEPADMSKAGAFVSLGENGFVHIDRGYVRRADEAAASPADDSDAMTSDDTAGDGGRLERAPAPLAGVEDDDAVTLPERLVIELTAYRSLALRDAIANDHAHAYLAVLHALTLQLFYRRGGPSCLQINASDLLTSPFPGLREFAAAKAVETRHKAWQEALPDREDDLWDYVVSLDQDNREALFAHCAGLTINAVHEPHLRASRRVRAGDHLASVLALDMTQAGWITGADNYFNRITKAQIVEAVREAKGDDKADLLADLKKKDMAREAERLLAGTGWLPECLRTPVALDGTAEELLPAFLEETALQAAE